jgi:hypothetical protein
MSFSEAVQQYRQRAETEVPQTVQHSMDRVLLIDAHFETDQPSGPYPSPSTGLGVQGSISAPTAPNPDIAYELAPLHTG